MNLQEEYEQVNQEAAQPAAPQQAEGETDIAVTAEQMAQIKQLAAAGSFEELGRMVASLLTPATA